MAHSKYIILLSLLVLVSGCTIPGTVSNVETGNGVVIKEFAPLFRGEQITENKVCPVSQKSIMDF